MKELVLHVGFHKTASTTIQSFLANVVNQLSEEGMIFPSFEYQGFKFHNHSLPVYSILKKSKSPKFTEHYARFNYPISMIRSHENSMNLLFSSGSRILLSAEHLCNDSEMVLTEINEYIKEYGYKVRVIAFIRDPLKKTISVIQERVKGGIPIENSLYLVNEANGISKLQTVFGENVEFHSFDEAIDSRGGIVGYFCRVIGIFKVFENSSYLKEDVNQSLSMQSARLASYVNYNVPYYLGELGCNAGRSHNDLHHIHRIKGDKFTLLRSEAEILFKNIDIVYEDVRVAVKTHFDLKLHTLPPLESFPTEVVWDERYISDLCKVTAYCSPYVLVKIYEFFFLQFKLRKLEQALFKKISAAVNECMPRRGVPAVVKTSELICDSLPMIRKESSELAYLLLKLAIHLNPTEKARKLLKIYSKEEAVEHP